MTKTKFTIILIAVCIGLAAVIVLGVALTAAR